ALGTERFSGSAADARLARSSIMHLLLGAQSSSHKGQRRAPIIDASGQTSLGCAAMSRSVVALLVGLAALSVSGACGAADLGVAGSQLLVDDRGPGHLRFRIRHDPGVAKGPAPARGRDPAGLDGMLQVFYTDTPDSVAGAFLMPAPWKKNRGKQARFVNPKAPTGPTAVRAVAVVEGKSAAFVAAGHGD